VAIVTSISLTQSLITRTQPTTNKKTKIFVKNIKIDVDIAETPEEKAKGLSGRQSLKKNEGMLFIFENNTYPIFWMKDMHFPIDIIWIADEKVVHIDRNVPVPEVNTPDSKLPLYKPPVGIDYVLEVNAGFAESHNIKLNDVVNIPQDI
jgi:uncharacterized membrane protein (UPF0127 family)